MAQEYLQHPGVFTDQRPFGPPGRIPVKLNPVSFEYSSPKEKYDEEMFIYFS
jgi:hypothetical protein